MIILVYGGAASGKSEIAERLFASCVGPRAYVATMPVYDEETRERVAKHVKQREALHVRTIECPGDITDVQLMPGESVMLEDLGTLLGDIMDASSMNAAMAERIAVRGVNRLCDKARNAIIVGVDIFGDNIPDTPEMQQYALALSALVSHVNVRADLVVEVVAGVPIVHKGDASLLGANAEAAVA